MSREPDVVAILGPWKLTRWAYDGAPLTAESGAVCAHITDDGALDCDFYDAHGMRSGLIIPSDVLTELVKDYEIRKNRSHA